MNAPGCRCGACREFFVTYRETCPECHGEKYLCDATWQAFHEAGIAFVSETVQREWWSSKGFDWDDLPAEEYPCPTCEGAGYVEGEVPLREALRTVL